MNIDDKIKILNTRIDSIEFSISEHLRILKEDTLQEGDEEVINRSLSDLQSSLNALNEHMHVLTNSLEML
jgi:hypothetical protein